MKTQRNLLVSLFCAVVVALIYALPVQAEDNPCLKCHAKLLQKKEVHAAANMGCDSCHEELDASAVPHKSKGKFAMGLSAEGPALCANCHDKKLFKGKMVHAPVEGGPCLGCHDAHASDYQGVLKKEPAALCLDCHPDVKKGPHVIAGFSRGGHPLGNETKAAQDPLRPGKKFYCVSCHEPHRSELPKLSRFVTKNMASCQKCHKM
ncbi:MAG: cytochrome c3 family protein [Betaproteobacteria bacterium]|nr:cytochrome c3 family protein [Betaproteobacteria bacterium]